MLQGRRITGVLEEIWIEIQTHLKVISYNIKEENAKSECI